MDTFPLAESEPSGIERLSDASAEVVNPSILIVIRYHCPEDEYVLLFRNNRDGKTGLPYWRIESGDPAALAYTILREIISAPIGWLDQFGDPEVVIHEDDSRTIYFSGEGDAPPNIEDGNTHSGVWVSRADAVAYLDGLWVE